MSAFNDVICFALYHSVADSLAVANKAVEQVRCALRLPYFTYRPSHSHSAHASTSTGPMNPSSPRPQSPSVEGKRSTPTGSTSGASTGPTNGKSDGAIYFECLNCKRPVSWILSVSTYVFSLIHLLQPIRQIWSTCRTDCVQSVCSSPLLVHGGWQRKPSWWVTEPHHKV